MAPFLKASKKLVVAVIVIQVFVLGRLGTFPQESAKTGCVYWQAKVDESLGFSKLGEDLDQFSEEQMFKAFECLLQLQGNRKKASFGGAMRDYISSYPEFTPVEVAALYYISYLYYEKFDHADLVGLVDNSGEFNSADAVKKAYASYRRWFKNVKKVGLPRARAKKLNPLANSKVKWYGN